MHKGGNTYEKKPEVLATPPAERLGSQRNN